MINMIKYKANLAGITVAQTNESCTSQTSSLDHEKPYWKMAIKTVKDPLTEELNVVCLK